MEGEFQKEDRKQEFTVQMEDKKMRKKVLSRWKTGIKMSRRLLSR
jgi:hypothetical protein